jgi:hypothetical protein
MFGSIGMNEDKLRIASVPWADFGPNLAIVQSFAAGHNFPTEYPHFIGAPIRYHFLFWFQAGNLEFLGLNLAWSLNILSVASLVAVLLLIATLGETLFDSRAVGRIAAALLFFHGSLSYVPFCARKAPLVKQSVPSFIWITGCLPFTHIEARRGASGRSESFMCSGICWSASAFSLGVDLFEPALPGSAACG